MLAQEETEVPWYLREEVRKKLGTITRAPHESRYAFERPLSPIAQHVSWVWD